MGLKPTTQSESFEPTTRSGEASSHPHPTGERREDLARQRELQFRVTAPHVTCAITLRGASVILMLLRLRSAARRSDALPPLLGAQQLRRVELSDLQLYLLYFEVLQLYLSATGLQTCNAIQPYIVSIRASASAGTPSTHITQ